MSDKTTIKHETYDIHYHTNHRQIVEVAIDWFLTKYDLHNSSHFISVRLTKYDKLQCWGESFQVDDLGKNTRYINLGEWVNYNTYAVFDGEKLEIKEFN